MNAKSRKVRNAVAVFCGSIMFLATSGAACFGDEFMPNALDQVWGKPVAVTKTATGAEKRYYDMPNSLKAVGVNYRYFVLQNEAVIADGMAGDLDKNMEVKRAVSAIPDSMLGLSKAYYEKNPTSIAELDKVWGTPVDVRKLDNGMEERYYPSPMKAGQYQNFICQDGRVIAGGMTFLSNGKADIPRLTPVVLKGIPVNKLDQGYVGASVQDIEKVWGKPVAKKTLNNGMEERFYKSPDGIASAGSGHRFFLVSDGKIIGSGIGGY